jgi:serine/threonine-protein kinase RsbW
MGTAGSASSLEKRAGGNTGTALQADSTVVRFLLEDSARADDAEWVAAELISNVLLHSRSGKPGGYFLVEVLRGLHSARVTVYDLGGGGIPVFNAVPHARRAGEGGHGLQAVAKLAAKTGVRGDPIIGHAVWAQLTLNPHDLLSSAS